MVSSVSTLPYNPCLQTAAVPLSTVHAGGGGEGGTKRVGPETDGRRSELF